MCLLLHLVADAESGSSHMAYTGLSTPTSAPSFLSFSLSAMSFQTSSPDHRHNTLHDFDLYVVSRSPSSWSSRVKSMMFGKARIKRIRPLFVFFIFALFVFCFTFLFWVFVCVVNRGIFSFLDVHFRNGEYLQAHCFVLAKHQTHKKGIFCSNFGRFWCLTLLIPQRINFSYSCYKDRGQRLMRMRENHKPMNGYTLLYKRTFVFSASIPFISLAPSLQKKKKRQLLCFFMVVNAIENG